MFKKSPRKKKVRLPKGFKAAPPIKNKRLRELVMGPDITTSGGLNTTSEGQPILKLATRAARPTQDEYWTESALRAEAQARSKAEKPIAFERVERELDAPKRRQRRR